MFKARMLNTAARWLHATGFGFFPLEPPDWFRISGFGSRIFRPKPQPPLLLLLGAVLALALPGCQRQVQTGDDFLRLSHQGKNYYEKGEGDKALAALQQALALNPASTDAHLNVAVAALLANQAEIALRHAETVLKAEPSAGAAHFVAGCAHLRLGQAQPAIQALQQAKQIDRTVNAASYQLARAYQQAGLLDEAVAELQELLQFEPEHPAGHYTLSQVLMRQGKATEASEALAQHQKIAAGKPGPIDPASLERCAYTHIRAPFRLEPPDPRGVVVTFTDATTQALGAAAQTCAGPAAFLDFRRDGRHSLLALESNAFRLFLNSNGVFQPMGDPLPAAADAAFSRCLVGDLNNDRVEDVVMLGERASHVLKFTTNGTFTDLTLFSKFKGVTARDGVLADLDFTGKLDLLLSDCATNRVRALRNLGHPYFIDNTTNSGLPLDLTGVRQFVIDDWNNDDLQDVIVVREGQPPLFLLKQRGGPVALTNVLADLPPATAACTGDLNHDLRSDLVLAARDTLRCVLNELPKRITIPLGAWPVTRLLALDYDNDGWLDLIAVGPGLRAWRNRGETGFEETTAALGLDKLGAAPVVDLASADYDLDGDSDLLLTLADRRLRLLRNQGGNANHQLKVQLIGTKSNTSGLGIRLEVTTAGLRLVRRVNSLPIEIGVGKYAQVDSVTAHWFDFSLNSVDVKPDPLGPLTLLELKMDTGSCPWFYAWDGQGFRFVTDILGAAPVGLPVSESRFVEADPEEYVWIGDEPMFPPREGNYVLQITEELREVLYLDEAKLIVVDHPPDTEVHTTGKLVPGRPFPPHEIVTLHQRRPLLRAHNHEGADVTTRLQEADGQHVSPTRLRMPQLKGLAEPSSVTLDFGPLPVERPMVLALTGWLRFGGGMANIAASHDPDLPFPFPKLEVETAQDRWQPVDVVVGAPCGKTKRMIVDLAGKLPPGARRLRLSTAYELHWDRIAMFEKRDNSRTRVTSLAPSRTDLHWRGYSERIDKPWTLPVRPDYTRVRPTPTWRLNVMGWCTRYGPVDELIASSDHALALINGGDELTLWFAQDRLPAKPAGHTRDFFLHSVGWDKDADFHCELGWQVEPLPWQGMDDQRYGQQPRPAFPADNLMQKYNTRWVGPRPLALQQ